MASLWVLCCFYSYSNAEKVTTEDLLGDSTDVNINDVNTSGNNYGMQGSEFTTGNQSQGGGSKTFDIDLSEYENMNSIDYGSKVYSHSSNTSVPLCANTTSDCKDEFKITVNLYNNGILEKQYIHSYVNIDWAGSKNFEYTQDVSGLTFNSAELELYGIDRGYYGGYFGPGFSDYYFTTTYEIIEIVIDQVLDQIEMDVIDVSYDVYEDISFEIEIQDPQGEMLSFEFDMVEPEVVNIQIDAPSLEEFSIEPTVEEIPVDMEVVQLDMEQMSEEIDIQIEVTQEEPDSEPTQESDMETEEEREPEAVQEKPTKEQVAQKIMARVVEQGNQQVLNNVKLAVMAQLSDTDGFNAYQSKVLQDAELYISEIMYDSIQLQDPYARDYNLAQDYIMEKMVNQQYGRN